MALNLEGNIRLSLINTVQAVRHCKSALAIFNNLLPTDPIKEAYYQDAINNLTLAYDSIMALPIDIQLPPNPIFPTDPIHPGDPVLPTDPIQIIRLSNIRAQLSLDMTNDAIKYNDQAILLSSDNDTLGGYLVLIRAELGLARDSLIAALDIVTL